VRRIHPNTCSGICTTFNYVFPNIIIDSYALLVLFLTEQIIHVKFFKSQAP